MNVVGLITEYNPFHNGHKYHLEKAMEITGADYAVVVMSGNFVQRGTPAITDKHTRAQMALSQGAHIVLELPVCYATGSAEYFAYGAVSILNSLGIVDSLCFGSECGNLSSLWEIADILTEEPDEYKQNLLSLMKAGLSFPAAREQALCNYLKNTTDFALTNILHSSNNILGIEYLKALKRLNSPITPYTLQRVEADYHDEDLPGSSIASATAIRSSYKIQENLSDFSQHIPREVSKILESKEKQSFPIYENDCSSLLYYQLRQQTAESLSEYQEVSMDLAKRIKNLLPSFTTFSNFAMELKTKQYTLTRINRALIHILLNIKKSPLYQEPSPYIRVLGLKKEASFLLNSKKSETLVPMITKVADAKLILSDPAMALFEQDLFASDLYNQLIYQKFSYNIPNDYQHPLIIK